MGRPIKKKWFSVKEGSTAGDLTLATAAGNELIINQKGTGKYTVGSGVVKLVDKTAGLNEGEASLQHNGQTVRKIAQYRLYYFSGGSDVWRDREANVIGTFVPALTAEGEEPEIPEVPEVLTSTTSSSPTTKTKTIKTKSKITEKEEPKIEKESKETDTSSMKEVQGSFLEKINKSSKDS